MKSMIPFFKYQGTGNDFVIIDQRERQYVNHDDVDRIKLICHRRFGIGADGLMLIERSKLGNDFSMVYFNSDGNLSTMCGNGGRCITKCAKYLGIVEGEASFDFKGTSYFSKMLKNGDVSLKMQDVQHIAHFDDHYICNTGSPHYVRFMKEVQSVRVKQEGAAIRYSNNFRMEGINVNFCSYQEEELHVKTYERGVEDETYSCGTGVVASALALSEDKQWKMGNYKIHVKTKGGNLRVHFNKNANNYSDIYLEGPAVQVFQGEFNI